MTLPRLEMKIYGGLREWRPNYLSLNRILQSDWLSDILIFVSLSCREIGVPLFKTLAGASVISKSNQDFYFLFVNPKRRWKIAF